MSSAQLREAKPFGRGIPTGPDVDKLMGKFRVPKPGIIYWKDIEAVLKISREQSRFHTVVYAWRRKLLEEYNVAIVGSHGEGILVLDEDERVYAGATMVHRAAKVVVRAKDFVDKIDDTKLADDASRSRLRHVNRAVKAIASVAIDSVKTLVEAAPKELKAAK